MDPRVDAAMGDASDPQAIGRRLSAPRLTRRAGFTSFRAQLSRERPGSYQLGAEGATAPETLRQKDRAG